MSRNYREDQKALMRQSGLYPAGDIAHSAGVSRATVYRMLRAGRLRGLAQHGACWVNLDSAIEAWGGLPPVASALRALKAISR